MARILLIEDEPRIALAIQRGLQDELHAVDVERDGLDGLYAARGGAYELILLDLMLPGLAGIEVCQQLRAGGSAVPILMLTARDAKRDVVAGLDAGADDYLTKPFSFDELMARVRALLRRGSAQGSARYRCGPLVVDVAAHRAWRGDEELPLTAREFQLLEVLVRRAGAVLTREQLVEALWERDMEPESNVIEVFVSNLRRKLDRGRSPLLHTVRGVGYVLREGEP